jgi:hypothetical protein
LLLFHDSLYYITVLTVTRVVANQLVAGFAGAAESVWQINTDLRASTIVDQTLVYSASVLFFVFESGAVGFFVTHLRHGYTHATRLIVTTIELSKRITFVHWFF